jgi:hypothetical protein
MLSSCTTCPGQPHICTCIGCGVTLSATALQYGLFKQTSSRVTREPDRHMPARGRRWGRTHSPAPSQAPALALPRRQARRPGSHGKAHSAGSLGMVHTIKSLRACCGRGRCSGARTRLQRGHGRLAPLEGHARDAEDLQRQLGAQRAPRLRAQHVYACAARSRGAGPNAADPTPLLQECVPASFA